MSDKITCARCPLKAQVMDHHECPIRGILDGPDMEACKVGIAKMAKENEANGILAMRQAQNNIEENTHAVAPPGLKSSKGPK